MVCQAIKCEKYPSKRRVERILKRDSSLDGYFKKVERYTKSIEYLWVAKEAGNGKPLSQLTPLQDECLIIFEDYHDSLQTAQSIEIKEALFASLGIKRNGG